MKGIPWHIFPTAFPSFPSALSPGKRARPKPRILGSGSEVLLQKFSERQSDKWEVDLLKSREKRPFYRAPSMECGLSFSSRGIHMLMCGRIIPAIGEPPTHPSVDSALELFCHLWVCLLAYRLGIKFLNLTCPVGPN